MADETARWARTRALMVLAMIVFAILAFAVPALVAALDNIVLLGFPLGFYMAAQGSLVGFVALVFWFCARQDAIDRQHGAADE
jgi:putative solute:sodium symporter small subunit